MLELDAIMVYRNPTYPDVISVVVQTKSPKGKRTKSFKVTEDKAEAISKRSFNMLANGHWNCYPYLFEHGGVGYMLARK